MADVPGWVTLTDGEAVVWTGGPSRVRVVQELVGEAVLVVLGLALAVLRPDQIGGVPVPDLSFLPLGIAGLGLGIAVVAFAFGLLTYLRFRAVEYVITTEELYVKRGLVSRTVRNLRLGRVQDSGFSQSAFQRVFGFGDVHVSTAGGSGVELVFRNVPDPEEVNGIITERLDEVRARRPRA